jgi:hypothetical protein
MPPSRATNYDSGTPRMPYATEVWTSVARPVRVRDMELLEDPSGIRDGGKALGRSRIVSVFNQRFLIHQPGYTPPRSVAITRAVVFG